ncbi:hypothetical protein COU60_04645 [Candidatus Pacearchaeota archaeon CG10_big_fil_rev_8_21_14_0_10_34_76]|nr:MAG: hypothetical protein COU60_04645 [Candidatus Pacearchaeota archaeon CG10_big_fil_rev_8_21_14_0_10_34_76]
MLNRRGHIPSAFLLVGAIVLVILTLFSFATFENKVLGLSNELTETMEGVIFGEGFSEAKLNWIVDNAIKRSDKNDFLRSFNESLIRLGNEERDSGSVEYVGNMYGKIANGDFILIEEEGRYNLEFNELFTKVNNGGNEIKRSFDLKIVFDKQKVFSGRWIFSCVDAGTSKKVDLGVEYFGCDTQIARKEAEKLFNEIYSGSVGSCTVKIKPSEC